MSSSAETTRYGSSPWTFPTLVAPLHGVGGNAWRDAICRYGRPGLVCAPFLRIGEEAPNLGWLKRQVHRTGNVPLSVQLLGKHPQHLASAAAALAEVGVDVVDLNLGCPSRQVVRKGAGAGLLERTYAIARIVGAMRAACSARLSVKLRAGVSSSEELMAMAEAIAASGADFLVLHPRTRDEGYRGVANWGLVKRVKSRIGIPVVGNGDLWYAADALRLFRSTGVDAVMIGRAALRNPYIFRQIEELRAGRCPYVPSGNEILQHLQQLAESFAGTLANTAHGPVGALKEQIQYVLRAVPEPARAALLGRSMRAHTVAEALEAVRPLVDLELDLSAEGRLRLETTPSDPI